MNTHRALPTKFSKACDECKVRKVRCARAPESNYSACINCTDRGVSCHFSPKRRRVRQNNCDPQGSLNEVPKIIPTCSSAHARSIDIDDNYLYDAHPRSPSDLTTAQQKCLDEHPRKLYVDLILGDGRIGERRRNGSSILKKHDKYVGSSGVAFFSERRIDSISDRLGHRKLWKIMETLSTGIGSRMDSSIYPFAVAHRNQTESALLHIPQESVKSYISAYFTHLHPIYPFLIQQEFEEKALDLHLVQLLQESVSFSALYHTILALGCQYRGSGSFVRGTGMAWKFYEVALGLVSEVLFSKESLLSVQALLAMGIFAQNASCMQIGDTLIIEAARMAQSFGFNKGVYHDQNESACKRTFWVIYTLEKMKSFACNRTSVLADFDIGTPMPDIPEAIFNGFNWFYSMVRFSRLISKAYETLFSISATLAPPAEIQAAIDAFKIELEHWRISIPEEFRPGDSHVTKIPGSSSIVVTIRVHYYYYSVVIALARLSLNLRLEESSRLVMESKKALLNAAQVIVELTRYIDAEAYTPIWILGSMPLTALFILFDFTVHNPTHLETRRNLSLLGAVAGYFCQLEFASDGALQTSVLLDLAHIARDYVQDVESGSITRISGHTCEDRHSRQSSLVNTDLVTPPFPVSDSDLVDQTRENNRISTENFCYPIDSVLLPMAGMFTEDGDLGDLFFQLSSGDNGFVE